MHSYKKNIPGFTFKPSGDIYQTLSPEKLLSSSSIKKLLCFLQKQARTSTLEFKRFYQPLIFNIAKLLQTLPNIESNNSYHNNSISWLEHALLHAARAMRLRHACMLPVNAHIKQQKKEYALWTYTIFSAALLRNIGKIVTHFTINSCDNLGYTQEHWNPLNDYLYPKKDYYQITKIIAKGPEYYKQLSTLIAKDLMPDECFTWITNNSTAFIAWLNALNDNNDGENSITELFNFWPGYLYYNTDSPLIRQIITNGRQSAYHLDLLWREINELYHALTKTKLVSLSLEHEQHNKLGKLFLKWLQEAIANKKISINKKDSFVHVNDEGLLLVYPDIFKEFCNNSNKYKDWVVVYKQFNHLGLTKKSGTDTVFSKFFYDPESQPNSFYQTNNKKEFKTAITMQTPFNFISDQKHSPINHAPITTKKALT